MKILYILQEFPSPPNNGIRWKIYNLLNYMAKKHECHIISFGMPNELERAKDWCSSLPGLKVLDIFPQPFTWKQRVNQAWEIIKGNPPSLGRWKSQEFANVIFRALRENSYDIVHLDMINMAQYWPFLQNISTVLSVNDAISMRYWRAAKNTNNTLKKIALTFSAKRIAAFESKIFPKFTDVHVVSEVDADYLLKQNPYFDNIKIISICVNKELLDNSQNYIDNNPNNQHLTIFTSGFLNDHYIAEPLVQFVKTEFRKIRQIYPNIEFIIIGRNAPKKIANFLSIEPGIKFISWAENYVQLLKSADIALFLDKSGSGIKNRVLQSLAAGKAVIGTPIAFGGLKITNKANAYVCNTIGEATKAVLLLLKDCNLRNRVGCAAKELVQSYYTQEITGQQWDNLYQYAIKSYSTKFTNCDYKKHSKFQNKKKKNI